MKEEFYKKAIEILVKNEFSEKEVCIKLAQEHPELFCKFTLNVESEQDVLFRLQQREAKRVYEQTKDVIQTIKHIRALYGLGLKEAKDIVDSIR